MRLVLALILAFSMAGRATAVTVTVGGEADPWLAGMPDGTIASVGAGFDSEAPDESPVLVPGLALAPGSFLTFAATGAIQHGATTPLIGPDGQTGLPPSPGDPAAPSLFISHRLGAEHGKSNVTAPIDALMGVFLDTMAPDSSPAPSALSFLSGDLDFLTLSPDLKQVFFIGDGTAGSGGASSGGATQEVFVPVGASRLYLGAMDNFGWSNNAGEFEVEVLEFVPEPTSAVLAVIGMVGFAITACRRSARPRSES